jgi:succinate dehydrogenase / fumarate reductase, cytochrome b subunit
MSLSQRPVESSSVNAPRVASKPLQIPPPRQAVRLVLLWQSSVGKKFLMAVTGIVLSGYVLAHLLGNFQLFMGGEKIDAYAGLLHANMGLLWTARIVLLAAVLTHGIAGFVLWLEKRAARPVPYEVQSDIQSSLASRTMIWSGLLILAFVVYHVLNLTVGLWIPGYQEIRPSVNVPATFHVPFAVAAYVISMIGVGFHLWHGLYSLLQSLGLRHPRYAPGLRAAAATLATLIALGNISIPLAVISGLVR